MKSSKRRVYFPQLIVGGVIFVVLAVLAILVGTNVLGTSGDTRSNASGEGRCTRTGGYDQTDPVGRVTGKCVCPDGRVITSSTTCSQGGDVLDASGAAAIREKARTKPSSTPKMMTPRPTSRPGFSIEGRK